MRLTGGDLAGEDEIARFVIVDAGRHVCQEGDTYQDRCQQGEEQEEIAGAVLGAAICGLQCWACGLHLIRSPTALRALVLLARNQGKEIALRIVDIAAQRRVGCGIGEPELVQHGRELGVSVCL